MKNKISVEAVRTPIFHLGENILDFLTENLKDIQLEGKVLAITSKIISLSEKEVVPAHSTDKQNLIKKESDYWLCEGGFGAVLTIKHGILIPSAGIDESNAETQGFILYPKHPYKTAEKIWKHLTLVFNLKNFGLILTDSHTMPLRRGVTGIGLAHWGFKATKSCVGEKDLFGRELKFTHIDVLDALAVMAVYAMGEGNESTPLALLEGMDIEFTKSSSAEEVKIEPEVDLYYPLLKPHLSK